MIKVCSLIIFYHFFQNLTLKVICPESWIQAWSSFCFMINAWPHVARMTMLGHMLPGWQCLATCYQDDTAEAQYFGIWDFVPSTIFFWSLAHQQAFFSSIWKHFLPLRTLRSKEKETILKDFMVSKSLEFYSIGINNFVDWWQNRLPGTIFSLIKVNFQGSYFDWSK